jgi:hypothetical protein
MQRYPSQTIWSLATSFHLMDYDKDLGLCSVRQPYTDVYTVMKNQSHASDSSDSRKSRNGRRSQDGQINVRSLKHELCFCPVSMTYPIHTGESRPHAHKCSRRCTHTTLSQRHLCTGFFHALSFELSFSHLPANLLPYANVCHACYRSFSCSFSHCSGV